MRNIVALCVLLTLPLMSAPTMAQDGIPPETTTEPSTRIEADSDSQEIRFYVDDELTAVLKDDGLHVRNSVGFGGTITDYGTEAFERFTGGKDTLPEAKEDGSDAQ